MDEQAPSEFEVVLEKTTLVNMLSVLVEVYWINVFRDKMNAGIHRQPTRLSPITVALEEQANVIREAMGLLPLPKEDPDAEYLQ
jgi:hypothetical protein